MLNSVFQSEKSGSFKEKITHLSNVKEDDKQEKQLRAIKSEIVKRAKEGYCTYKVPVWDGNQVTIAFLKEEGFSVELRNTLEPYYVVKW